jgi:hypothetical protein
MCYLALGVIGVCITPGRNGFGYGGDITHCSNSYCLIILDVPHNHGIEKAEASLILKTASPEIVDRYVFKRYKLFA